MDLDAVERVGLSALLESVTCDDLTLAIDTVRGLLDEPWLNAANRRAMTGLHFQLKVKFLALSYLENGYDEEDRAYLTRGLSEMQDFARENSADKMLILSDRLRRFFDAVGRIMCDADLHASRIRDREWNVMSRDLREVKEVQFLFAQKLLQVEALPDESPFGQYQFPNVKEMLATDLEEVCAFAERLADNLENADVKHLVEELLTPNNEQFASFEYCPTVADREYTYAGAVVVCTPFADELELYALSYSRQMEASLAIVECSALNGKDSHVLKVLFSTLAQNGQNLLLRGLESYRGEAVSLYESILSFGKTSGKKVFIMDPYGDKRIYNDLMDFIRTDDHYKPIDVAFAFLGMPSYREVTELLEQKRMLKDDAMRGMVKKHLPFMGFVGLNLAAEAYVRGRDWLEAGRKVSEARYSDAVKYLSLLPTQSLFLHSDWGEFSGDITSIAPTRPEIDYDDIRDANPQNIKKIVQGNFTIFEKCGLICRYCLTHGEDISVWAGLPDGELKARLTEAVRLVARVLGISLDPEVTIHEQIPDMPTALGLCIGGGKEIQFKRSGLSDLTGTIDTICHECYHAFQHMATHTPFCEWYWHELGVTRGRLETWLNNQNHYFSSSDKSLGKNALEVYYAQVVESEARAFATDCLFDSEAAAQKIQWE